MDLLHKRPFFRAMLALSFVLLLITVVCPNVSAHAPLIAGSNEQLSNATLINNPEKSFAIYDELHQGGEAQYYHFVMQRGERLYGSLQVPGPDSMVPGIVLMGPGIESDGKVPSFIEVPAGAGARVIPSTKPGQPSYEPFSPQAIYEVARFNETVPRDGDYYIAVYGTEGGGYGLAPGFIESFTPEEWLIIPLSVIEIHLWQGQPLAVIIAPLFLIVIIGLLLFYFRQRQAEIRPGALAWMCEVTGLLYFGGSAITAVQALFTVIQTGFGPAILVTLVFIIVPLVLGGIAIRIASFQPGNMIITLWNGIQMLVIGIIGMLVWAGLLIGPVLAIATGVLIMVKFSSMSSQKKG